MTQPAANVPVQVGAAVAPGPDGQPWVRLQIQIGLTTHGMLLPPATATELGPLIAKQLTVAAANARRAALGLIVPGNGQPTDRRRRNGETR